MLQPSTSWVNRPRNYLRCCILQLPDMAMGQYLCTSLYDVHGRRDKTIVIYLKDENYDRFIVKVQDPVEVVTKTNEALDAERSSLSRTRANKPGNGLHLGTKAA